MIYNLYIYDRHGNCIYFEEWHRTSADNNNNPRTAQNVEEELKLMYGLLWSLKSFVQKSSPFPEYERTGFHSYKTNAYKLHFFETPSSIKFILTSEPDAPDLRDVLRSVYKNVFVEYVMKNPLYKIGDPIKCELFIENLQKEIKAHPLFKSPPTTKTLH